MGQQIIGSKGKGTQYGYPGGFAFRSISEQVSRLRKLFPGIGFADEMLAERPLPRHAEGWVAIPRWQIIGATYGGAFGKVLTKIADTRSDGLCNHCEGKLGRNHLRQTMRTEAAFSRLEADQRGYDILVVAVQLGRRHRGRSVDESRAGFRANEFGLNAFPVATTLLVHPERFERYEDLGIDCAGDEYVTGSVVDCARSPCFFWCSGKLRFDAGCTRNMHSSFGTASAFLSSQ